MNTPFRAIISDLDGTLLNAEHTLGQFTIETLEKLAAAGVDIFLATGRSYPDVQKIIAKVKVQAATLVTANGARANNLSGELLANFYLPEALALDIMQHTPFDRQSVCLNSYQGDEWFINVDVASLRNFHQDSGFMYQVVDFNQHHGKRVEKLFFIGRTPDSLLPVERHLTQHYGDQIQLTYSTPQCLEIMAKGVCKANTLKTLVESKGYTLSDCVAFGDGMNDLEMLTQAGKGCLMANADPRLKQQLPHNPVIGNHSQEAVAQCLREMFGVKF